MRTAYSLIVATAFILSTGACNGDNNPVTPVYTPPMVEPTIPRSMVVIAPAELLVNVGSTIAPGPKVTVFNANSRAIPGTRVTFEVTTGGGSVNPAEAVTKSDGSVTVEGWNLGPQTGANSLVVRAGDVSTTFTLFGIEPGEQPIAHYRLVRVGSSPVPYQSNYNDIGAVLGLEGSVDLYSSFFIQTFKFQWAYGKGDPVVETDPGPYSRAADGSLVWGVRSAKATLRGDSLYVSEQKLPDDLVVAMVYLKQ